MKLSSDKARPTLPTRSPRPRSRDIKTRGMQPQPLAAYILVEKQRGLVEKHAEGLADLRNSKDFEVIGAHRRMAGDEDEGTGRAGHKGTKDLDFSSASHRDRGGEG